MYVTKYEEYPIYEPAEGGYYYAGEQATEFTKVKAGKGTKEIRKLYRILKQDCEDGCMGYKSYAWISDNARECGVSVRHIGEGFRYVLEGNRRKGKQEHGWQPYC